MKYLFGLTALFGISAGIVSDMGPAHQGLLTALGILTGVCGFALFITILKNEM